MKSYFGARIEECIILFIIILNILEFFGLLPPSLDYTKKIISWSALGYVLYHAGLSEIFFGHRKGWFDASLILTYFLFMLKELVGYAHSIIETTTSMHGFFSFLLQHAQTIELTGLVAGGILLILFALYACAKFSFAQPSLLACICKSEHPERRAFPFIKRFVVVYAVLVAFFVMFFNLFMEWLAIVIDAPILMMVLFAYIFVVLIGYRFSSEGFMYRITTSIDHFYNKFVHLFQRKETIFLGISGMLVLHLLTEITTFIFPLLFSGGHSLYLHQLGFHEIQTIYTLFSQQLIGAASIGEIISIAWIYLFNISGILFLLSAPAIIWLYFFKEKPFRVSLAFLFLFYISLTCFILAPMFSMKAINNPALLVGVELSSHIFTTVGGLSSVLVILVSFIIALAVALASLWHPAKLFFIGLGGLAISAFFGWYISLYFLDQFNYYLFAIPELFSRGQYFVSVQFIFFLIITIGFYIGGYFVTIGEFFKELRTSD